LLDHSFNYVGGFLSDLWRQFGGSVEIYILLQKRIIGTISALDLSFHLPFLLIHHFVLDFLDLVNHFLVGELELLVLTSLSENVVLGIVTI
jgi:hypothetical protein